MWNKIKKLWNDREGLTSIFVSELVTIIIVCGIFYISKYISGIWGYLFTTIFELVSMILFSHFIYKNGKRINVLSQTYELTFWKMRVVILTLTIVLFSASVLLGPLKNLFTTKNLLNVISLGVTLFIAWFGYFKKVEIYNINVLNEEFDIKNFLITDQMKNLCIRITLDGENTGFIRYRGICFEKDLNEIKNKSKDYEDALWGQNLARSKYVKIKPHEASYPIFLDLEELRKEWCVRKESVKKNNGIELIFETSEGIIFSKMIRLEKENRKGSKTITPMKKLKNWFKKYGIRSLLVIVVVGGIVGGIFSYCCSEEIGDAGTWYSGIGTILAVVVALTAQKETRREFQEEHTAKLRVLSTYRAKRDNGMGEVLHIIPMNIGIAKGTYRFFGICQTKDEKYIGDILKKVRENRVETSEIIEAAKKTYVVDKNDTDADGKTLFYPSDCKIFETIKGNEIGEILEIKLEDIRKKLGSEVNELSIIYVDPTLNKYIYKAGKEDNDPKAPVKMSL